MDRSAAALRGKFFELEMETVTVAFDVARAGRPLEAAFERMREALDEALPNLARTHREWPLVPYDRAAKDKQLSLSLFVPHVGQVVLRLCVEGPATHLDELGARLAEVISGSANPVLH